MSQPTCAACLGPITAGSFVIAGSEVIHKACVGRETLGWKQRRRIAEAEQELAVLRREMPQIRNDVVRLKEKMATLDRAVEHDKGMLGIKDAQLDALRLRRDEQDQENARLRGELEVAQRAFRESPRETQRTSEAPLSNPEPVDGTVARFALLELD